MGHSLELARATVYAQGPRYLRRLRRPRSYQKHRVREIGSIERITDDRRCARYGAMFAGSRRTSICGGAYYDLGLYVPQAA